jgi:peptidoglycan hydrolase-like protein with peptidoglycan-binding domain
MASRLITTSFALVSTAALLAGCDTVSGWLDGNSHSGSTGVSQSSSAGKDQSQRGEYDRVYSQSPYGAGSVSTAPADRMTDRSTDRMAMASGTDEAVSGNTVKHAQQSLKEQGLYDGAIDGIVGPRTRDAVSRYQRNHNLKQTAMLDRQTLRTLDAGNR